MKVDALRQYLRHAARDGLSEYRALELNVQNRLSRRSVVEPRSSSVDSPVVSLTTFGRRVEIVHLAIESIAQGSRRPSRIILWHNEEDLLVRLPDPLERLSRRGLEVRYTEDYRSHKKWFPYVSSYDWDPARALVTVDDDAMYPRDWLERLLDAHRKAPDDVIAHRARYIMETEDQKFAPYETWPLIDEDMRSPRVFPGGLGGVLYPAMVQASLRSHGAAFQRCCPLADDIWLHANTIRAGSVPHCLAPRWKSPIVPIRRNPEDGLWLTNVVQGENDKQLSATYTVEEMREILGSARTGTRL